MAAAEIAQIASSAPVSFQTNGEDSGDPCDPEVRDDRRHLEQPRRRHSSTEERVDLGQTEKQERTAGRVGRKARVAEVRRAQQGQTDSLGAEVIEVESKSGARGDDQPEDNPRATRHNDPTGVARKRPARPASCRRRAKAGTGQDTEGYPSSEQSRTTYT
jgi:hypothetical protein